VHDIFETRFEYETVHSFQQQIISIPPNSRILCVARSLFHILNKEAEIKAGLSNGIRFEFACLDPSAATEQMTTLTQVYPEDIRSSLISLKSIARWAVEHKLSGSIELRYHTLYLPDSFTIFQSRINPDVVWDLSFGRDLTQKRVVFFRAAPGTLGDDLFVRYDMIWSQSEPRFLLKGGKIELDQLT